MRNFTLTILISLFGIFTIASQNIVKGIIIKSDSEEPIQGALISLKSNNSISDSNGVFTLLGLNNGKHVLKVSMKGFETQNFPINLTGQTINLGTILMYEDITEVQDLSTIIITDDELSDDEASYADNISGLLQASQDVYLRTAAFDWSSSFYRIKGLSSENGKVLINWKILSFKPFH